MEVSHSITITFVNGDEKRVFDKLLQDGLSSMRTTAPNQEWKQMAEDLVEKLK